MKHQDVFILGSIFLLLVLVTPPAQAVTTQPSNHPMIVTSPSATITVTNTNDSGAGSLRQAIADANPGDTIDFDLTYPVTITLTNGQLIIEKDLTIGGPGASNLIISGNYKSRIFTIGFGFTVPISGVTIANSYGFGVHGGGIYNNNTGTLTVINSTFLDNSALTVHAAGGSGGAIYSSGTLSVINCIFSGNSSVSTFYGGGGIFIMSGSVTVSNTTFLSNLSRDSGGGIFVYDGTLEVQNSTFSDNYADYEGVVVF